MGSCKIPSQLVGCLSTLSSCWALSWPRSQDKLEINFYKPASLNNRFNSFNNSNSSSSNKDNNNSSDNKVGSGNKVGSSNQDSSSSNQDSSSNSNQDNSSSNQDSSSNSNQDSSSNSNQDSSSNSNQDSSSSKADSHLSKDSHPSKLWTDSVDLLLLLNKLSNKFHPDPKFSSTLRLRLKDNVERVMVGSPWSCLMKSSLALLGTSWRSQAETTPNGSPTHARFSTGSSPTSCFRVEILRISMGPAVSPSTDQNSTTRTSW